MTSKITADKILKFLATIIALTFLISFLLPHLKLYFAIEKSNKEASISKCKDGILQTFTGTIQEVDRYDYDNYMNKNFFSLHIKTTDSTNKHIDYQFILETNKVVLDFAQAGQQIRKDKGNDFFKITNSSGQQKTFKIPDCD